MVKGIGAMRIGILGGGLSGVVLAYLLQSRGDVDDITIFERESTLGGLCRSFQWKDGVYDVGPHILFSKNPEVLHLMLNILNDNVKQFRRNVQIYLNGRFIKYPFENHLASLSEKDRRYCIDTFLDNPYLFYTPKNMLQFFLKTFGEGITNLYLRPYNEKIWKYDPAFMGTQLVDRVPNPPLEDIVGGAHGQAKEGYLHQLTFYYPAVGGIQGLVKAFVNRLSTKVRVGTNCLITQIQKGPVGWTVNGLGDFNSLISTIPLELLTKTLDVVPDTIKHAVSDLKYNSLITIAIQVKTDNLKDYLTVLVPDKNIIFHRITKLNFLGPREYSTLLAEVTYREGDSISFLTPSTLLQRVKEDLLKTNFITSSNDYIDSEIRYTKYAYVIPDLKYQTNIKRVKDWYAKLGLHLCGRFGEHEYLNMDGVIARCLEKAKEV